MYEESQEPYREKAIQQLGQFGVACSLPATHLLLSGILRPRYRVMRTRPSYPVCYYAQGGVIRKMDYRRVTRSFANPWDGEEDEVEALRQAILSSGHKFAKRDFAIVTLMAKAGLRVSEATGVKLTE